MLILFPLLIGCIHAPPAAPPFLCAGTPEPVPTPDHTAISLGMVSVQRLSAPINWHGGGSPSGPSQPSGASIWGVPAEPAPAETVPEQVWFEQQAATAQISVMATAAPLHQLILAVGQNLSLDVTVSPDAGMRPVSAYYHDTSLENFLQMLQTEHGIVTRFENGALMVSAAPDCSWCAQPMQAAFFDALPLSDPTAVAAVYCQDIASPGGSAAIIGDQIYVRDIAPAIADFTSLYATIEQHDAEEE